MPHVTDKEMTRVIHQANLIAAAALALDEELLMRAMLEVRRTEAVAPVIRPTWYRDNASEIGDVGNLISALLRFRQAVQRTKGVMPRGEEA